MIQGEKYHGMAVDIWSAGVTLYAMLVGYLPFEDPDTIELYRKITLGDYEEPDYLSPQASQALKIILHIDPAKRATIQEIRQLSWVKKFGPIKTTNTSLLKHSQTAFSSLSKKFRPKKTSAGNMTVDVKPLKLSKLRLIDLTAF